ncbi:SET domain protein [Sporothrix schenckii 1099-18]|uniref:SET domain-containing protein n=2 Tax=Sporothrix schenckii TaxID=29908 RepID=U7PRU9_SPOS1|nr:SET domain protein [Sporothrix schenckii 1099-18]ERS97671.1 hypothetical protein HMPREF1624_05842 [Sporothrix schenckii ATCC 58251]KJR82195.1 SET domain protein [Sporothrix schenckii 1099-18]
MAHAQLPITSLPLWETLNNVTFTNTRITAIPGKGFGLVSIGSESSSQTDGNGKPLISVPHGLVLHVEAVEEYAKQDRNFRLLLDAVGHQTARGDILLFLLVQLVLGLRQPDEDLASLPTPWTEYVRFLPADVPLPTLWTDAERLLLQGTSLESAVGAKLIALEAEFDQLREHSSDIPFWQAAFWDRTSGPELRHWFLVDAWYRSRCLDLPRYGPSMVPCIDMVNHSDKPNAYYEEASTTPVASDDVGVVLLVRPQQTISASDEITISYCGSKEDDAGAGSGDGNSGLKPASEMLFSYGFIDPASTRHSLVLPFQPFPDDPLAKAKLHVFGAPVPRLEIECLGVDDEDDSDDNNEAEGNINPSGKVRWTCPFVHLMCVNEEDGIDFRLRQETDGSTQLRMFWQDEDITDRARDFEMFSSQHTMAPIFRLRVVTVLQEVIESHLERMQAVGAEKDDHCGSGDDDNDDDDNAAHNDADMEDESSSLDDDIRSVVAKQAALLRDIESRILSAALEALEAEVSFKPTSE